MKASRFTYLEPVSVEEAITNIAQVADREARILAGGQTLIPAMAMRLARPSHLIDINRIRSLERLQVDGAALHVGACVRHAAFHEPVTSGPLGNLLSAVVRHIAHLPIRNRGTLCGSLANADAASEWCLVAATLGATMLARSARGDRLINSAEFFCGFMTTALTPDELLLAVLIPVLPARTYFGFVEFSRRAGDFAQAMSLVVFESDGARVSSVRIGIGGVEAAPRRVRESEECLEGVPLTPEVMRNAAEAAAQAVEPTETTEELQTYKRRLVRAAVLRALVNANASVTQPGAPTR